MKKDESLYEMMHRAALLKIHTLEKENVGLKCALLAVMDQAEIVWLNVSDTSLAATDVSKLRVWHNHDTACTVFRVEEEEEER